MNRVESQDGRSLEPKPIGIDLKSLTGSAENKPSRPSLPVRLHPENTAPCPRCGSPMTQYINRTQACLRPECAALREREHNRRRIREALPPRYRDADPELVPFDLPDKPASVLFTGKVGRGKTYAAAAMVSTWDVHVVTWIASPLLLARLRSTFRDGSRESELDVIRDMTEPAVLVLDDFGAEKGSEYSLASLYCVLSERENRSVATVVTTNLDLAVIQALDARIASRLAGYHPIHVAGDDRRLSSSRNPSGIDG